MSSSPSGRTIRSSGSSLTMAQDGGPTGYEAFVPAIRMMSGQKPKVNTIFFPLPIITNDNIGDF